MEVWKVIPFAPRYEVSSYGRVRRMRKNGIPKYLAIKIAKTGYCEVSISIRPNVRKTILLHRLVLSTFNPVKGFEQLEVNHIDENKQNCRLDNLQWMTSKENCNYGIRNQKISAKKEKTKIQCIETGAIYESMQVAAKETGLNPSSICMACKRTQRGTFRKNQGTGLHFKYVN